MMKPYTAISLAAAMLTGCASVQPPEWSEAILIAPAPEAVTAIVQTALSKPSVLIAHDSLTQSSRLIVELATPNTLYGERVMGRRFGGVDHFTLEISGQNCRLRHEETDKSYAVTPGTCMLYTP